MVTTHTVNSAVTSIAAMEPTPALHEAGTPSAPLHSSCPRTHALPFDLSKLLVLVFHTQTVHTENENRAEGFSVGSLLPYSSTLLFIPPHKALYAYYSNCRNERLLCKVQYTHRGTKSFTRPACNQSRRVSKMTRCWGREQQTVKRFAEGHTKSGLRRSGDESCAPGQSLSHTTF